MRVVVEMMACKSIRLRFCITCFLIMPLCVALQSGTQVFQDLGEQNKEFQRLALQKRNKMTIQAFRGVVADTMLDDCALKVLYKLYRLPCENKQIFSLTGCFKYNATPLYKLEDGQYVPLSLDETPELQSRFMDVTGIKPLLHGIELTTALDEHWSLFKHKTMPTGKNINKKYSSYLITVVRASYERYGSIPIIAYHMANPYSPVPPERVGAYQNYVDRKHKNVVGEMRQRTGESCGYRKEYNIQRDYLDAKLDALSEFIKQLTDKNGHPIPCIIRPFHEMDMNSFWWGVDYCSAEDYKWLFRYTKDRVSKDVGTHSLIWGFSLGSRFKTRKAMLERYPGDEYVDIIGSNEYNVGSSSVVTKESLTRCMLTTQVCFERNKIACLFESGVTGNDDLLNQGFYSLHYPSLVNHEGVYLSFFIEHGPSYAIPSTEEGKKALRKFARSKKIKKDW